MFDEEGVIMQETATILKDRGIRPSLQRVCVYRYLRGVKTHPTVDEIYSALLPEYPSLSRTTVYNTLELLIANDLAISLDFGDGFLRYDADCSPHSHFKCKGCGKVFDIMLPPPDCSQMIPSGFTLMGTSLYMFGLCDKCSDGCADEAATEKN